MYPRLRVPTGGALRGQEGERVAGFSDPRIAWRKSTASDTGGCVEVAVVSRSVLVRDSANPGQIVLRLSLREWSVFLRRVRRGEPGSRPG